MDAGNNEWIGRTRSRVDVEDQEGARLGPVALPELAAEVGSAACEEERAVDIGQTENVGQVRPWSEVFDQRRSGGLADFPELEMNSLAVWPLHGKEQRVSNLGEVRRRG